MPLLRALPEISQFSISYIVISISDEARRMPFIRDSGIDLLAINLEQNLSSNVKNQLVQPACQSTVASAFRGGTVDVVRSAMASRISVDV